MNNDDSIHKLKTQNEEKSDITTSVIADTTTYGTIQASKKRETFETTDKSFERSTLETKKKGINTNMSELILDRPSINVQNKSSPKIKNKSKHVTFNKNKFVEIINIENWSQYNRMNVHSEHYGEEDIKCKCLIL